MHTRLEPVWNSYKELYARLRDENDLLSDAKTAEREQAIDEFMSEVKTIYGANSNYTFYDELTLLISNLSGTETLTTARMDVDRAIVPFEHQIYDNANLTFEYGISLQVMLLHLYWEYCFYTQTKYPDRYELVDSTTTDKLFQDLGDAVIQSINDQVLAASHLTLAQLEDTTVTVGNNAQIPVYQVKLNENGQSYLIGKQTYTIKELNTLTDFGYFGSADGVSWKTPETMAELQTIFPITVQYPMTFLKEDGGLTIQGPYDVYHGRKLQPFKPHHPDGRFVCTRHRQHRYRRQPLFCGL